MKKAEKFVAECGSYFTGFDLTCGGDLTPAQKREYEKRIKQYHRDYERCIRDEDKYIVATYKYAMKKALPVCIKELRRIDDKKANQIADEFKNVVKPIVRTLKKAITLALKHDNQKLSDKFLKILIAVQQYQDRNA